METDKEIIRKILTEEDNSTLAKERLYRLLSETSADDVDDMDTDLIEECVKAIELLEGREEHLSEEKIQAVRESIEQQYQERIKKHRKIFVQKRTPQVAAAVTFIFLTTSAVANALGYSFFHSIVGWGKDTFNLTTKNQTDGTNLNERKTYASLQEVEKNLPAGLLLPTWIPEGFEFKYAEKIIRPENIIVSIYYQDKGDRNVIINASIYDHNGVPRDINFEKDENLVEVYNTENVKHHIFINLGQAQAVWIDENRDIKSCYCTITNCILSLIFQSD